MRIEPFHDLVIIGRILIVIALDDTGKREGADDIQTFFRIRIVADNITQADILIHFKLFAFLQNGCKSLQVSMNVT